MQARVRVHSSFSKAQESFQKTPRQNGTIVRGGPPVCIWEQCTLSHSKPCLDDNRWSTFVRGQTDVTPKHTTFLLNAAKTLTPKL